MEVFHQFIICLKFLHDFRRKKGYDKFAGEDRTLQDIEDTIFHFPLFFPQRKTGAVGYALAPVFLLHFFR